MQIQFGSRASVFRNLQSMVDSAEEVLRFERDHISPGSASAFNGKLDGLGLATGRDPDFLSILKRPVGLLSTKPNARHSLVNTIKGMFASLPAKEANDRRQEILSDLQENLARGLRNGEDESRRDVQGRLAEKNLDKLFEKLNAAILGE